MPSIWTNAARRSFASGVAIFILACGFAAIGQATAKTHILTEETVKHFIASFPAVKAIALSQAADKGKAIASAKNNLAAVIAAVADKSIADQVTEAVKPHGFKNAAEWASVGESVGRVYAHLKLGTADGRAKKKLAKAIAKIERNDFLNEKQKQKLTQAIRSGAEDALEPPPAENVQAVKPMVAELEAMVK
jgi:hypothetical protein